jgi:hypothetical protein
MSIIKEILEVRSNNKLVLKSAFHMLESPQTSFKGALDSPTYKGIKLHNYKSRKLCIDCIN